ncbi:unnamed protein product [Prunus armeniaca]
MGTFKQHVQEDLSVIAVGAFFFRQLQMGWAAVKGKLLKLPLCLSAKIEPQKRFERAVEP